MEEKNGTKDIPEIFCRETDLKVKYTIKNKRNLKKEK